MGITKLYCHTNKGKLYNGLSTDDILTIGKLYNGNKTPALIDPATHKLIKDAYIIMCDDNILRRIDTDFFITLNEFRHKQLNELGI